MVQYEFIREHTLTVKINCSQTNITWFV